MDITYARALAETVARAKREILADAKAGVFQGPITTFADLHDYADANVYGGFCAGGHYAWTLTDPTDPHNQRFCDFVNEVQNQIDAWIKLGGLK